jgi:hypothetical protein
MIRDLGAPGVQNVEATLKNRLRTADEVLRMREAAGQPVTLHDATFGIVPREGTKNGGKDDSESKSLVAKAGTQSEGGQGSEAGSSGNSGVGSNAGSKARRYSESSVASSSPTSSAKMAQAGKMDGSSHNVGNIQDQLSNNVNPSTSPAKKINNFCHDFELADMADASFSGTKTSTSGSATKPTTNTVGMETTTTGLDTTSTSKTSGLDTSTGVVGDTTPSDRGDDGGVSDFEDPFG